MVDIQDLLPQLKKHALALKHTRSGHDFESLSHVITQVGLRWGYAMKGSGDQWNKVIDRLDDEYPGWRGYMPGVRQ
ncbi:MAG: hypothetical protein AAF609_18505 [Cyanobacteria bacterium P01_C01_bin.120]